MTNKTEMPDVLHVLRTNTNYIGSPHQTDERDTAYIKRDTVEAAVRGVEGTLKYLQTQARNGTLHPQVVIQNAETALAALRGLGAE